MHALTLAHARFGRLAWTEVVAPAIQLARESFSTGVYIGVADGRISGKAVGVD